jgi:hypothetical protein
MERTDPDISHHHNQDGCNNFGRNLLFPTQIDEVIPMKKIMVKAARMYRNSENAEPSINRRLPRVTDAKIAIPPSDGTSPSWLVRPFGTAPRFFFRDVLTIGGMAIQDTMIPVSNPRINPYSEEIVCTRVFLGITKLSKKMSKKNSLRNLPNFPCILHKI